MAAAFVPKAYTNGKRTEIANSPQEEANLLWDGWWVTGSYTPPPSPDFVTEGELAPVAKTGAYADLSGKPTVPTAASLAAAPELKAAYVALPSGGTDGQVLGKSGSNIVWLAQSGGSGGASVTDNGDGTAVTTSTSVVDNGDGTAAA